MEDGIMTPTHEKVLLEAVKNRKNILISGGTGSGKTTLANAILKEIAKTNDRLIIIEDTQELMCLSADKVNMRTKKGVFTINDCLRATLRFRPDRIIVGEVRGGEALDLIKAWNTGTPGGIATLHADDARQALNRLEQLILEVSINPQKQSIGHAIDYVIQISKTSQGRKIQEIIEVNGHNGNGYIINNI